ncbi:hypothetical protein LAZ67_3005238 [Cordylochernes scorpioides]|uniref:Uncharacterized protein n=1 Tax=Cordylochernes scorpioides TaxID=51811 RepID=A0ABY6KB80_9ARAC|nr:hypothetical protein LAZ67_3005238 [Cordylochernes scorpioides]
MPIAAAVIPYSGKVACKITFNCRNSNFKMVELSELSYYRYCRITDQHAVESTYVNITRILATCLTSEGKVRYSVPLAKVYEANMKLRGEGHTVPCKLPWTDPMQSQVFIGEEVGAFVDSEGRQNVHDDERSGSPVTATDNAAIAAVRNVVEADRRVTIDDIMIRLPPGIEIRRSSIGIIMSDVLNFLKVCTRWVPRLLLENHKQQRMEAARAFLEMHQRDGDQLFSRIVTGDVSWVHHSTPETKRQSMVWKKPEESAPKRRRSQSLQAKLWLWKTSNGKFSHIHLILRNLPQATSIFIQHSSGTLEASTLRMMTDI